jgi:hypothetical protein
MKKMDTQFRTQQNKEKRCQKEPNDDHRNTLKEEILHVITESIMEMLLDMVNQIYKRHSRNFKTSKIKNTKRHRNK